MNLTPLMAAAAVGNVALVQALIERGADREASDHFGCNALHWAMLQAFQDGDFGHQQFPALYELLAPGHIDLNTGERLVRIDRHLTEYFLLQTLWVLTRLGLNHVGSGFYDYCAFDSQMLLHAWEDLPTSVLRAERNKRAHISNVLSRNEVNRDYAYNRKLFLRIAHGRYQFNPALSVRRKVRGEDTWVPLFEAMNLRWLAQFVFEQHDLDSFLPEFSLHCLNTQLGLARLEPIGQPVMSRHRVQP